MRMTRAAALLPLLLAAGCAADDYAEAGKAWEGKQPLAALEYYRLALAADPAHPVAAPEAERHAYETLPGLVARAQAEGERGDWVAAVGLLHQAAAVAAVLRDAGVQEDLGELEQAHAQALGGAAEQRFAEGEALRTRGEAKQASIAFRSAIAYDPAHPLAQARYDEQRAAATHRLAVMPFACELPDHPGAGRALADRVTAEALGLKPEFLRFVDRVNLDRLLDELDLNATGLVDPETAAREGKLLGVSAVLLGELSVKGEDSGWENTPKESTAEVEVDDGQGGKTTKVLAADYTISARTVTARAVVSYRIISAETGEVLAAASAIAVEKADAVEFARLRRGDAKAVPKDDRELLLVDHRETKTFEELARAAFDDLAGVVANDLVERFP